MNWKAVRALRTQPTTGNYSDWKNEVAADCGNQCLYCAISEARYGGIDNFHVDHFRPKKIFKHLIKDINNLVLACAICNRFKLDAWPCDPLPDNSHAGFPDPALHDYSTLFAVDSTSYAASSHTTAGSFVVQRLYLNRPQLLRERRAFFLDEKIENLRNYLGTAIDALIEHPVDAESLALIHAALKLLLDMSGHLSAQAKARPYEPHEVKRPKKSSTKKAKKKAKKKPVKRRAAKGSLRGLRQSGGGT